MKHESDTLTEITEASRASIKEVGRPYRYISREFKLNLQPASPSVYIIVVIYFVFSPEKTIPSEKSLYNNLFIISPFFP